MVSPVLGPLLLAFGIACVLRPRAVARFEERMDSIGSKRAWAEVEPADWKVTTTRIAGVAMLVFGAVVLLAP